MYFDILNRLGVDHEYDGQTDGHIVIHTKWALEIAHCDIDARKKNQPQHI